MLLFSNKRKLYPDTLFNSKVQKRRCSQHPQKLSWIEMEMLEPARVLLLLQTQWFKKKKKSLLNVLKGSVLPGPWWPKTPGRQQDRVLSPFFGILHMTSWHLLRQHDLQSHDTAWGTGRVLESSPLQMNITNIPIFQGTPDICRQEKLWALQHWAGTSTEILK